MALLFDFHPFCRKTRAEKNACLCPFEQIEMLVALWESEGKILFSENGQVLRSRLALYEAAALKSCKRKPIPMHPEQLRQGWNVLAQVEGLTLPELPTANLRWERVAQFESIASEIKAESTLFQKRILGLKSPIKVSKKRCLDELRWSGLRLSISWGRKALINGRV